MKYTDSEKRLIKRFEKKFGKGYDQFWFEKQDFLIKEVRRAYKNGYIDGYSDGWEDGREELL